MLRALDWLVEQQILTNRVIGAITARICRAAAGLQYANRHYPDLDDTAAVAWALIKDATLSENAGTRSQLVGGHAVAQWRVCGF